MDKSKYIQDAELLIKATKKRNSGIKQIYRDAKTSILPAFTRIKDGWINYLSGLGSSQQKSTHTTYRNNFFISDELLHSLYISNGMSKKISKVVADDAFKNGITIQEDEDNLIQNKLKTLAALKKLHQADLYRRHYGGAIVILGINDGNELWEELNINNIQSIDWLRCYSRVDTFFTTIHFSEEINSPYYGQPEFYTIVPKYTTSFNVHASRVLEFKGTEVPTELDTGYRYYWGQSIIEPLWDSLKKVGACLENLDQLLYETTIGIYKYKEFSKLISEGKWEDIKTIIDQQDLSKSTIRSILMDTEDDYQRDSLTFTGIKEVVELLFTYLAGEANIPISRLFGKQLGGLNNKGEMEQDTYYDDVKAHQVNELLEQVQKLVTLLSLSKEFKNKVKDPIVEFNSPYQLTEKEKLGNKKTQAEIDLIYINTGVLTTEEIRESRFENGYNFETSLIE